MAERRGSGARAARSRQDAYDRVCARNRGDSFAKVLCGGSRRPEIRDFAELYELVGLADRARVRADRELDLAARQSRLGDQSTSPGVPARRGRSRPARRDDGGRLRARRAVRRAGQPRSVHRRLQLLPASAFEQKCNYATGGCDLASLLTEEIEHDWTAYSVYDQDDLEGTSLDCNSCHQPDGHGTKRILRMQELASPWLHWFPQRFVQRTDSDRVLLAQFADTHEGDEHYGGIPIATIANALDEGSGAQLEALVRAEGFGDQPNPFDAQIVAEMKSGSSPTWEARFETHLQGRAIAVPYPAIDVTDEAKRNAATRSYQDVVRGAAARGSLVDIRDIFSDGREEKLSFVPQPGADGKTVLLQMCARCHDGRANPQLSKNRFNVRRARPLSRAEKDLAIARVTDSDGRAHAAVARWVPCRPTAFRRPLSSCRSRSRRQEPIDAEDLVSRRKNGSRAVGRMGSGSSSPLSLAASCGAG